MNAGEVGCGGSGGTENAAGLELADGIGGTSPMLVSSGVAGLGTNIVFLTSLLPLRVPERLDGAACYRQLTLSTTSCTHIRTYST